MSGVVGTVQAVVGAVYVLFVPGLALSFALFRRGVIDWIERVALSFALSIAVVPLLAFYLNLAGVKIRAVNVIAEVAAITAVALGAAWQRGSFRVVAAPSETPIVEPTEKPKAKEERSAPPKRKPVVRL